MKETFEDRRLTGTITLTLKYQKHSRKWSCEKLDLCKAILKIVNSYATQGYKLTLRQLYYQLVSADLIPNHDTVYNKLSSILDDLRYSGYIDWDDLEDRGREPYIPYSVEDIQDALRDTASHYRLNRQRGQNTIVEVCTEKDAISGILKRITRKFHVRLLVNKGYSSSTAMHRSYQRYAEEINKGNKVVVLYFGDHDPSGLDMIRDIRERIMFFLTRGDLLDTSPGTVLGDKIKDWWEFAYDEAYDSDPKFVEALHYLLDFEEGRKKSRAKARRSQKYYFGVRNQMFIEEHELFKVIPIGLTMDQIKEFNPPPNPAKLTDPRSDWYVEQFGEVSWEVDAIEPKVMERIVTDAIEEHIDVELYFQVLGQEKEERDEVQRLSDKYGEEE